MTGAQLGKIDIVLIEDNPSDVYLMDFALKENGFSFELTNFRSGNEALLTLCPVVDPPEIRPVPDVILLDLNTPASDGFEVLSKIRGDARLSRVPVAIVTSSASPADRHRAALMGATSYFQKPTELVAFIEGVGSTVKQLLAYGPNTSSTFPGTPPLRG